MNIKKIIREVVDGLDWIRDTRSNPISDILHHDLDITYVGIEGEYTYEEICRLVNDINKTYDYDLDLPDKNFYDDGDTLFIDWYEDEDIMYSSYDNQSSSTEGTDIMIPNPINKITESDDLGWMDDISPNIQSVDDIEHFIDKPFNIVLDDGTLNTNTDDNIFWIGDKESDSRHWVYWNSDGKKGRHHYSDTLLVSLFNPDERTHGVTWKFI